MVKGWILSLAMLMVAFPALAQSDVINKSELAPQVAAASGEKMEWLPSFTGVSVDGLFKITFIQVPTDQAPRIVFNTRGIYDTRFKAEVNEEKMLSITERIGSRTKSDTEVTIYYNTLETIRIAGADASFESPIDCPMAECRISDGATVRAEFDTKDLQMEITGKSVVVLTGSARYWDLSISTGQLDASQVECMALDMTASNRAEVTIQAPERLKASVSTRATIRCKGQPELLHTSNSLIGGKIQFE